MRVPQVSERIKEAPAQALRGVFAGIGQLLLITDKLRNKAPADVGVPRARTPEHSQPVADATVSEPAVPQEKAAPPASAPPASAPPASAPPAPAQPAAAKPSSVKSAPAKPATDKPTTAKPTTAKPAAAKPPKTPRTRDFDKTGNVRLLDGAETAAAAAVGSKPGDASPPLPNYDELSVASLRARLRNLDLAQVRQLAEYERAHAARADVVGMFERRIAKLEADA
jgi:hypothetical protein